LEQPLRTRTAIDAVTAASSTLRRRLCTKMVLLVPRCSPPQCAAAPNYVFGYRTAHRFDLAWYGWTLGLLCRTFSAPRAIQRSESVSNLCDCGP
jgi:hypothetical protein